ncbi:hypothetical protein Glove_306g73 [Diversispora epigaea]|uniref:NADP-dependent oxidoreductase domain-containing protein n=1 Tax=Diversispora epigaea TaxID=1348612 RepID=A0A397HTT2_9GLOM|nr:hypothetical protein Glove_306g73 [Diversispora epigaea]
MTSNYTTISHIGLGTYRMCTNALKNKVAFYDALTRKPKAPIINVIDTSPNFFDLGSEKIVGEYLGDIWNRSQKENFVNNNNNNNNQGCTIFKREDIFLSSKFGNITGENIGSEIEGLKVPSGSIVRNSEYCYHCIHPEFMRAQLYKSLEQLKTNYLDIFFINNPEHFLKKHVTFIANNRKVLGKVMLERISETFIALEQAISQGLIRSYGISSSSFALPNTDVNFLPYENLLDRARNASRIVRGTENHGFTAIQFPANMLEPIGLATTAKWAKSNGLKVFVNRPFNAFTKDGRFRLASYPKSSYDQIKKTTIARIKMLTQGYNDFHIEGLIDWIIRIDSQLSEFESIYHFDAYRVILEQRIKKVHNDPMIRMILKDFINGLEDEIKYRDSRRVKTYLRKNGWESLIKNRPIEEVAYIFLKDSGVVDCVLMELTAKNYVDFAIQMLEKYK